MFYNTRDPWAQVPKVTDLRKDHFNIPHFRVRYYVDEDAFTAAEIDSGLWNCLRRIDSDRSRKRLQDGLLDRQGASVSLMRSKLSFWLQPAEMGQPVTAILLVDPTPLHGQALWGGPAHEPGEVKQDIATTAQMETATTARLSLFDRIVRAQCNMSTHDMEVALKCPKFMALPSLRHVMAEWLLCIQYMTTQLGKLEWEFEKPHWGEESSDVDSLLKKGSPWNRNIRHYQEMLRGIAETLFEDDEHDNLNSHPSIRGLRADIKKAERRIENVRQRLERLQDTAASVISIEDSRRATRQIQQNQGTARLTLLATIFLPLNFATSFLSMSSDFSVHNDTFRLFFIVSAAVLGVILAWMAYVNRLRLQRGVRWMKRRRLAVRRGR
ncbi:hypothetical protein PRZ48_014263 [Zasmidium cellare]|uniref:Uncharacterized protein n=1 Tax=Zasmidium cellare TaxID=395010 RepID=A0ABR0E0F1_ZASCE|nr:hypothetical protein PRZ48_014263 [Zasmidium cellare]